MRAWLLCLITLALAQDLAPECEAGEYEVDGHKTGVAVSLDYETSRIEKDSTTTYLVLDFLVPTLYMHNSQNVSGIMYDRAVQITFHDRNLDPLVTDACYSNRNSTGGSPLTDQCPEVTQPWVTAEDSNDGCLTRTEGTLRWDDMMQHDWHDAGRIEIQTGSRVINNYTTPTWDVYMMAVIETWVGFEEKSELADSAGVQLVINDERYSYYEIPFVITWPKQITLVSEPIRIFAPLVTLYAVIVQETVEINFNPDIDGGENFGVVELTIKTQTQYPFGLLPHDDPNSPALVNTTTDSIESVVWVDSDPATVCDQETQLCEQEWKILITPELCSVTGNYQMQMWAVCYTDIDGCPLDDLAPSTDSNTYTGILDFTVEAQDFCPTVIDEITVAGEILKFTDDQFAITAEAGVNTFSNDHVYFEVVYTATSEKSGIAVELGDDTLIEYVKPTQIKIKVEMTQPPLQTEVVDPGDGSYTCLEYYNDDSDDTCIVYELLLCTAANTVYPYDSYTAPENCFNNMYWHASNQLDFAQVDNNLGDNTIELNEIGFTFRLDERVIPVDIPNDEAKVTITVDSEVYYYGNNNPERLRRILKASPSNQKTQVFDNFAVTQQDQLQYCLLDPNYETVGMLLDVEMNELDIPNKFTATDHVLSFKYQLTTYFHTNLNSIEIVGLDLCSDDNCNQLYRFDEESRRALSEITQVRYYLLINGRELADVMQTDFSHHEAIYESELFENKIVSQMLISHCDEALNEYMASEFTGFTFGDGTAWSPSLVTEQDVDDSSMSLLAIFAFVSLLFFY